MQFRVSPSQKASAVAACARISRQRSRDPALLSANFGASRSTFFRFTCTAIAWTCLSSGKKGERKEKNGVTAYATSVKRPNNRSLSHPAGSGRRDRNRSVDRRRPVRVISCVTHVTSILSHRYAVSDLGSQPKIAPPLLPRQCRLKFDPVTDPSVVIDDARLWLVCVFN